MQGLTDRRVPVEAAGEGHRTWGRRIVRSLVSTGAGALVAAAVWSLMLSGSAVVAVGPAEAPASPGAAATCVRETEPNDQPDTAVPVSGSGCLTGSLPDGDGQDTWVWTITDADAQHEWTISLSGISGAKTSVQLQAISSPPGVTPVVWGGTPMIVVETGPGPDAATSRSAFIPAGRYVLGVGRTASLDGSVLTSQRLHHHSRPR